MATGPFYDTMPGPLRRDTLNEMWEVWQDAIGTPIKGDQGWSPLIRSVQDGIRVVLEVYDWMGGQGVKPTQTGFLGSTGFVATADLAIDIRGPQGLQGDDAANPVFTASVDASVGTPDVTVSGTYPNVNLAFSSLKGATGDNGDAATVSVGTVTTSPPGTTAEVVNSGSSSAAVLDFTIPQGAKGEVGDSGTISVGTTTTVPEGTSASVTNTGTQSAAIFNFSIPKGDKGDTGTAATITVGTVTTGAPGTPVVVTNSGTPGEAVFDFTIPRGADGSGTGDMLKSDYDSVGDGVVNASRSTPWTGVTGKPAVIAAGADAASARSVIAAASTEDLNIKAPIDNPTFTGTVSGVTKAMVGLADVDNTSDLSKPISTATQAALSGKSDTGHAHNTASGAVAGFMSAADKAKLDGIAVGATSYTHPANHPPSIITQDANNRFVTDAEKAAWNAKQANLVSGTNIKTLNGESLLGVGNLVVESGASIPNYSYENRASLRTLEANAGDITLVDGLGLFVFAVASDEPDDDESCFATASGKWLMECPHWDVVDAWQLPENEVRDEYDEDEPLRFASSFASRVLSGTATCAIISVAATASARFTGTVTGASVGDRVIATPPAELGNTSAETGRLSYHAWVSAVDTVTVMLTNASAAVANTNTTIRTAWPITVIKS